jgi:hypothetical protein
MISWKRFKKYPKCLQLCIYFLIFALIIATSYPQMAKAAPSITAISDTTSRLKVNENSSHVIKFTTGDAIATGPGDHITITFPADFDFSSKTIGTLTFTHGASSGLEITETLAASPTATDWGAVFSGTESRIVTLTVPTDGIGAGSVAAGNKLIITYDNTNSANASSANNYVVTIAVAGSTTESGSFAIPIITDDQVVVSTTIDPYVTFVLTTNSVTLTKSGGGNPDNGHTGYNQGTANTLEAYTNAGSGYSITYYGDTLKTSGGVHSIAAMGTKTTSTTNTEQFGINLKLNTTPATGTEPSGSGSGTPESDYITANNFRYITNTTTPLASAIAATASNVYTVTYIVNVAMATSAGAYSTTITYICTGNF